MNLILAFLIQSGSILNSWATKHNEIMFETSLLLAKNLSCNFEQDGRPDVDAIAHCIRQAPAPKIQV